jgi:hypothetical protein
MNSHHRGTILGISILIGMLTMAWLSFHQDPRTPTEALEAMIRALDSRNEGSIRALSTKQGFKVLWDEAKRVGGGKAIAHQMAALRNKRWNYWDSTHASAVTGWRDGISRSNTKSTW